MARKKERTTDLRRLIIVVVGVLFVWTVLIMRLVHIQLINKRKFVDMGIHQYVQEEKIESARGIIYDRNKISLAINQPVYSLAIDLTKVTQPKQAAVNL